MEPSIRVMKIERGARSSPRRSYFHQFAAWAFDLRLGIDSLLGGDPARPLVQDFKFPLPLGEG